MKTKEDKSTQIPKDGESSNASRQFNDSLVHSPLDHSPQESLVVSKHPTTSLFSLGEINNDQPDISNLDTGWSAPIWSFDDALKLIRGKVPSGNMRCNSCGRVRQSVPGIVIMICPACQEEMENIKNG